MCCELHRISFAHKLFCGTQRTPQSFDPNLTRVPSSSFKEPTGECLVLRVLAQQDEVGAASRHSRSQPLAKTSESLSTPSIALSAAGLAMTGPDLSRLTTIPWSTPR